MKFVSLPELPEEAVSHNPEIRKKVILREGDLPICFTKLSQAYFRPGQQAGAHAHEDMYEVFLVDQGCGLITVEGREKELRPGTCVVVEPGETHDLVNTGEEELIITYFGLQTEKRVIPGYD